MNIYVFDNADANRPEILHQKLCSLRSTGVTVHPLRRDVFLNRVNCTNDGFYNDCTTCGENDEVLELCKIELPAVIFVHASNPCYYQFAKQFLNNPRCIIVSYSGEIERCAAFDEIMNLKPNNIKGYKLIGGIKTDDIDKMWNLKQFTEAFITGTGNHFDVLERKSKPYLSALSFMCIGFLAQNHQFKTLSIEMGDNRFNSIEIWKEVLGLSPNLGAEFDPVQEVIDKLEGNNLEIISLIKRVYTVGAIDLSNSEADKKTVSDAYKSIPVCLHS